MSNKQEEEEEEEEELSKNKLQQENGPECSHLIRKVDRHNTINNPKIEINIKMNGVQYITNMFVTNGIML